MEQGFAGSQAGCRSLARGGIPVPLGKAAKRYAPCAICDPPELPGTTPRLLVARDGLRPGHEPGGDRAEGGRRHLMPGESCRLRFARLDGGADGRGISCSFVGRVDRILLIARNE
jgi:hypothetical protein